MQSKTLSPVWAIKIQPVLIQTICESLVGMIIVVALLSFLMCTSPPPRVTKTPHVTYSVSGLSVTIVSAVTPHDSRGKTRDVFLYWFKRGFETVLTGKPPLMIEWDETTEGIAGQMGYTSGMNEGERFMKKPQYSTIMTAVDLEW